MTTFAVTIESTESQPLSLLVESDNWVAAWQEGLRILGIGELPPDSQCVVNDDGRVDIDVPTLGRRFVVKPLASDHDGPRPRVGKPLLMSNGEVGPAIQMHHATKNPKLFRRPPPPNQGSEPVVLDTPVAGPPTPDPIARILSDLERQRLLSQPIRISPQTGLPTRTMGRPRRRETKNAVPRAMPTTDESRRPRELTLAFPAVASDQLPQQFHPVQTTTNEDIDVVLQWAVETAWQHVPCALAMLIICDEGPLAEVLAARGERERESRGCSVPRDSGPTHVGHGPSLMRFPGERPVRFHRADGSTWDLPIESVLSVPVEYPDGELAGIGLLLLGASRASGFTDSELRAVTYLARTLGARM